MYFLIPVRATRSRPSLDQSMLRETAIMKRFVSSYPVVKGECPKPTTIQMTLCGLFAAVRAKVGLDDEDNLVLASFVHLLNSHWMTLVRCPQNCTRVCEQ